MESRVFCYAADLYLPDPGVGLSAEHGTIAQPAEWGDRLIPLCRQLHYLPVLGSPLIC